MTARTVLLVRHGETPWNRTGRIQGWAPVGLTEAGRERARALGATVASAYDVDRLVASDLCRTRETVALLREHVAADAAFAPDWRERDLGVYQGMDRETLAERFPALRAESGVMAVREQPPGGEQLLDFRERVLSGWERVRTGDAGTTLVVTHGGPISLLLGAVRDQNLLDAIRDNHVGNCSVTELRLDAQAGAEPTVVRENIRPENLAADD